MELTLFQKCMVTLGMAVVPVVELRGAIPAGVAMGLSPWLAFLMAIIGNMLPVPFIILLIRQIFAWLKQSRWLAPLVLRLEDRAQRKGGLVRKYSLPGLLILVAIPLPGTGAWTGALVAALLGLRMNRALPAIFAGVLIAGLIVAAATMGVVRIL